MARGDRIRHQLFLPREPSQRLAALAARDGVPRSSLLAAAVTAYLDRRGTSEIDERFGLRLDAITRQLARIERDGHVQLESLALFVRYMLTVTAPLADDDETGRAIGRDRFAVFVARVARQLVSGRRSLGGGDEPEAGE